MPSIDKPMDMRKQVAARYLSNSIESKMLPGYLGARLSAVGLTNLSEAADMPDMLAVIAAVKEFCAKSPAVQVGPYVVVPHKGSNTRIPVNDLLVFPSIDLAQTLSEWLAGVVAAHICVPATEQFIKLHALAVASGKPEQAVAAGAKLSDMLDSDWTWQLLGLRYAHSIKDGPQITAYLRQLLLLPREGTELINVLTEAFQKAMVDAKEPATPLSSFAKDDVFSRLAKCGHLPWSPQVGLTAALSLTRMDNADVKALETIIPNAILELSPAYWHQLWQSTMSIPEIRADVLVRNAVTEAVLALCSDDMATPLGSRAWIYNSLAELFFYRLETQYRGVTPIGVLWCASKLASDIERSFMDVSDTEFVGLAAVIDEHLDRERDTWAVCSVDVEPSTYHDIFANKRTLWPMAIAAAPGALKIDQEMVSTKTAASFEKVIQSAGLFFALKAEKDTDVMLPVLDLISQRRLGEWGDVIGSETLKSFLAMAESTNSTMQSNEELLQELKTLDTKAPEDSYLVLLRLLSRLRARTVSAKALLEVIGVEQWITDVMPKLVAQQLDLFLSSVATIPVSGQRDDVVQLAHWGAYCFETCALDEDHLKTLIAATVVMSLRASSYSAVDRLNSNPNRNSGFDAQEDIQQFLETFGGQAPIWARGKVRACRVALLPVID